MKASQLHDLWDGPDNSRLTTKQFSFRFPVHIAAKIAALCEIYPQKSRTHIVADLLTSALDELEKNLPESLSSPVDTEDQNIERQASDDSAESYEERFYLGGARGRFRDFSNQHFQDLEKELGNEKPSLLYPQLLRSKSDIEKNKK